MLDADGRELQRVDDDYSAGADSRVSFTVPHDGRYYIRLRDVQHRGGNGYYYRLRSGRFPLASVAYPAGGRSGSICTIEVSGPAVTGIAPIHVRLSEAARLPSLSLGVRFPDGDASGFVTIVTSTADEVIEEEPNDEPDGAMNVVLPCSINGRLGQPGDRDFYQFEMLKGQRMLFRGRTRDLGSASDLFVRLYKSDGGMLAEVEDSGKQEGLVDFTFPADGTYRLMVEDLLRGGGPDHVYRVEVEPATAGFSLDVAGPQFNAPRGGTIVAKVTASRRDYKGPIELSVTGAGDDLVLENHVIEKDKSEVEMKVTLPPRHEPGTLLQLQVVGRADIDGNSVSAVANAIEAVRQAMPNTPNPPLSLGEFVPVGIGPPFAPFFELNVEGGKAYFPQRLGSFTFRVNLKRLNDKFKDPISVAVEGLPEGITAEVKPVDKGESQYEIIQKGPEEPSEGTHEIRIVGTGTFQNHTKRVVLEKVPLHVVKPLLVSLTMGGPVAVGGKQTAKVHVTRFGEDKQPVVVRWRDGPAGLVGPLSLTIPRDKDELEFEFAAAADAATGAFDNLIVSASTEVKDQPVAVESPPTHVEIQAAK